jgi:hypothetical protein
LKRKYFFAVPGKKDWSGKPGFRRFWKKAPEMRPNFLKIRDALTLAQRG